MWSKRGRIEAEICLYKEEVTLQRILTEEETKEWGLRFLVEECSRRSDQRVRSVYASSSICVQTGLKAALIVPILECRGEDRRQNARPYDRAVYFFCRMESFSNSTKGGTIGGVQKAECLSVANFKLCASLQNIETGTIFKKMSWARLLFFVHYILKLDDFKRQYYFN